MSGLESLKADGTKRADKTVCAYTSKSQASRSLAALVLTSKNLEVAADLNESHRRGFGIRNVDIANRYVADSA